MGAKNGDAVRVHDTRKFEDGGVFGTSRDHQPPD
jgi:FKBP-type peptidyl-prolyl cis-trans isomerase